MLLDLVVNNGALTVEAILDDLAHASCSFRVRLVGIKTTSAKLATTANKTHLKADSTTSSLLSRKQFSRVSFMTIASATTASWYGRIARKVRTHNSTKTLPFRGPKYESYRKDGEFNSPRMVVMSGVSLKSGSNPILPPGEECNINPSSQHSRDNGPTKINVNDVGVTIDHNIPVVAIFCLKNVAEHTVCCHALSEAQPRLTLVRNTKLKTHSLKLKRRRWPKFLNEEGIQRPIVVDCVSVAQEPTH